MRGPGVHTSCLAPRLALQPLGVRPGCVCGEGVGARGAGLIIVLLLMCVGAPARCPRCRGPRRPSGFCSDVRGARIRAALAQEGRVHALPHVGGYACKLWGALAHPSPGLSAQSLHPPVGHIKASKHWWGLLTPSLVHVGLSERMHPTVHHGLGTEVRASVHTTSVPRGRGLECCSGGHLHLICAHLGCKVGGELVWGGLCSE